MTAAGVVTLVCSGLVLLLFAVFTAFLLLDTSSFLGGFAGSADVSYLDPGSMYLPVLIVMLVVVGWSLLAVVLAIGVLRRSNIARILLLVSAGLTAAVSLLAITGGAPVVTLAGSVAVIVLLFTGGASDWFHHEHVYSPPKMPTV